MAGKPKPGGAERALKREIQIYGMRTAKLMMAGLILAATGISIMIFMANRFDQPAPQSFLYRQFGPPGLAVGRWTFGPLLFLFGCYWLYRAVHRMRIGQPAYEAKMRNLLGMPGADTGGEQG